MKKVNLLSVFFLFSAITIFAQGNSCEFFAKSYGSQDGFSFFRPAGTAAGSAFDIDTALLRKYEFASAYAYYSLGSSSRFDSTYTFQYVNLLAETNRQSTGNKQYSEVKSVLDPWFANVVSNLSAGCLAQLDHSQIFFAASESDRDVSWAYFYPKQANIPAGSTDQEVKAALAEVPYIKVILSTPIIGTGYSVKYNIGAYQYTKKS